MEQHRSYEDGRIPHRSGRLRYIGGQWYFSRRNETMAGPFENQEEAERACENYVQDVNHMA